jgi:hypothetical protein
MVASCPVDTVTNLYTDNTPAAFWQLLIEPRVSQAEWTSAIQAAASVLPLGSALSGEDPDRILSSVLSEEIFGLNRWQLNRAKRLYYELKPLLPRQIGVLLRQHYRRQQEVHFDLGWPIEDRYVRFQFNCVQNVLRQKGLDAVSYVNFWPHNHRFAFTLTHDIETEQGFDFVQTVADLEERLGFRSSFNVVPERYPIDHGLLSKFRQRGFEIGVHGLKHDSKLFSSRHVFEQSAEKINRYLREWEAVGFRAPYMHRNPEWLQALNVEYDLSFFDTDPYEPMPGGTMSIWPFSLGSFVELPYTLAQDHTLMAILGACTPRLWLDKVDFIERWQGLALVNVHPDYLRKPEHLALYEDFLLEMKERENYWHALPREVARWWKLRSQFKAQQHDGEWDLSDLLGATVSQLSVRSDMPTKSARSSLQSGKSGQDASVPASMSVSSMSHATRRIGAMVVGGCFQGLDIVRSLGRLGRSCGRVTRNRSKTSMPI